MDKRASVELWRQQSVDTPTTPDFDLVKLAHRLDLGDDLGSSITADFLGGDREEASDGLRSASSGSGDSLSPQSLGVATEAGSSATEDSIHRAAGDSGSQLPYLAAGDGPESAPLAINKQLSAPQLSPEALFTASPTSWASASTSTASPLGAPFGWPDSHDDTARPISPSAARPDRSPVRARPKLATHRSSMGGIQHAHRRSHSTSRHPPASPGLDDHPLAPDLALSLHDLGVSVVERRSTSSHSPSPRATPNMAPAPFASTSILRSPVSPARPALGRSNSGRSGAVARRRSGARTSGVGSNILHAVLPKRRAIAVAPAELLTVAEAGLVYSPLQSPATPRPGKSASSPMTPLIIDVRPLPAFLEKHIRGSVNANFPSLLMKRFRKGSTSAFNLESFLTTESSKRVYQRAIAAAGGRAGSLDGLDLYVVDDHIEDRSSSSLTTGASTGDILCSVLERIRDGDFSRGAVYFLRGAFVDLQAEGLAARMVVSDADETAEAEKAAYSPSPRTSSRTSPSTATSSPLSSAGGSPVANRRHGLLALQQSPIIRQPAQQAAPATRAPGGGLRICTSPTTPTASTLSASPSSGSSSASVRRAQLKRLDTGETVRYGNVSSSARSPAPPALKLGAAAHGSGLTIQALAHRQSKSPVAPTFDLGSGHRRNNDSTASNATITEPSTPHPGGGGGGEQSEVAFEVSTIIPGVLYLGPDPSREEDVRELEALGVARILNMAVEVPDRPELRLAERFQKVERLPMRDFVEETGIQARIDEACAFLDDAGLHSKPVFLHCRAGKSRSVMITLAYLIHRFRWPLKRAYAHVTERRPGASPNLGFVAELLRYEERELGVVKAATLGSSVPAPGSAMGSRAPDNNNAAPSSRVRESLPPAPTWQRMGEREAEQEVKGSGGLWTFAHRPPVDADFLPSRRASKAGLESASSRH